MTPTQKQRLSEIRRAAKDGMREGYLRASGIKTLPALDIDLLLDYIGDLENLIKQQPTEMKNTTDTYAEELVNMEEWDDGASAAHTGAAREENPHPKDDKAWDAWNAGYDAESQTYAGHFERISRWDVHFAEVEATLQNWPTQPQSALASESQREAAGTADEKPDGQAENA